MVVNIYYTHIVLDSDKANFRCHVLLFINLCKGRGLYKTNLYIQIRYFDHPGLKKKNKEETKKIFIVHHYSIIYCIRAAGHTDFKVEPGQVFE